MQKAKPKDRSWIMFAVLAGLCWGVWGVIAKLISAEVNPYMNHILFTAGMLFTLPFALTKQNILSINFKGLCWGIIAGVFAVAGNLAVYYAFSRGGLASIVIPMTNLYPLVTIFIAILFFKERLNIYNVAGLFFAIAAILMLSGQNLLWNDPKAFFTNLVPDSWLWFSFFSVLSWGIFSAAQKITTNHISANGSYLVFVLTAIILSVIFLTTGQGQFYLDGKTILLGVAAGMLNGFGVFASFAAYRAEGKASAVTTLAAAVQPVFTIVLAFIFLNETFSRTEAIGVLAAIAGASLLSVEKRRIQNANITEVIEKSGAIKYVKRNT